MRKQVYISADYSENSGDRDVIEKLHQWGSDSVHKVNFIDMSQVAKGSVSDDPDCRPCDLKKEFNAQINASSVVIFIVGDKTSSRTAGSSCDRNSKGMFCSCTPYKQNANGTSKCKIIITPNDDDNVNYVNALVYAKNRGIDISETKSEQKRKLLIKL